MSGPKIDYDKPVDPKSKAWCSEVGCPWKAWGIWSHTKAKTHHEDNEHMVHLVVPDDEETKAQRAEELARLDAEYEKGLTQEATRILTTPNGYGLTLDEVKDKLRNGELTPIGSLDLRQVLEERSHRNELT